MLTQIKLINVQSALEKQQQQKNKRANQKQSDTSDEISYFRIKVQALQIGKLTEQK